MKRRALLAAAAPVALPVLGAVLPASSRAAAAPAAPGALEAEIRALLARQAAQWTAGDLEGFCSHYADDAIFVSPSGRTDGRQAVYDRYKKKYVDKKGMGALSLDVLHVVASDAAASVVLTWRLAFEGKAPAQGYSVIGLARHGEGWRIVHDASL